MSDGNSEAAPENTQGRSPNDNGKGEKVTGQTLRLPNNILTALEAFDKGFQPVPIRDGSKSPYGSGWQNSRWENKEQIKEAFTKASEYGANGVGILLGAGSNNLIDVDLDHPLALKLRDFFLPPTPMETGRPTRPGSHRWYIASGSLPDTRRYKMPDGSVTIELRSTKSQTVIPPSVHPDGEPYVWEGLPWGGAAGPAVVDGQKLAIQVALLNLAAVLIDKWPAKGSRHEAYLALAGGLLRVGEGINEYWESNLTVLIGAIAEATYDEDGPESRVNETIETTLSRLREGGDVTGFPRLGEILESPEHAEQARRMAREVESLSGFTPSFLESASTTTTDLAPPDVQRADKSVDPEERNPLEERISSWESVDLEPYLLGKVSLPKPALLQRVDGMYLMYPGRVNSIYGKSESAKSWIALQACVQEMGKGERVVYIDLEDEPSTTIARLRVLGVIDDDIFNLFRYLRPESPLAAMERTKFGPRTTEVGKQSLAVFLDFLKTYDPTLIIVDGMTSLYGLHGLDTNDAMSTDVVTTWLKSLTRGGRTSVIVIDHTGKGDTAGAAPIGAHHKIAMVQGTALRADAEIRPMPGSIGRVKLTVYKDRPGEVRQHSAPGDEQVAGVAIIDSTKEGSTEITIQKPDQNIVAIDIKAEKANELEVSRIINHIQGMFGGDVDRHLTTRDVMGSLGDGVDKSLVYRAWEGLEYRNIVTKHGSGRWTYYALQ